MENELEVAGRLALEAGALVRRLRAGPLRVDQKAGGEVVTAADLEADALIRAGLSSAFPGDAIFSEETPDTPDRLSSPRVWIVDPIDATSNFAEGGDEYSVSVGLAVEGRAVLGAIYNPAKDELFAGAEGFGVTMNSVPVQVTETSDLACARLTISRKEWVRGLERLAADLPVVPMASVAYKLARVAAGLDDGMFSTKLRKEWDICAGVALVLAAGGAATLFDGREIRFNRLELRQPMGMLASGPGLYRVLLEKLNSLFPKV